MSDEPNDRIKMTRFVIADVTIIALVFILGVRLMGPKYATVANIFIGVAASMVAWSLVELARHFFGLSGRKELDNIFIKMKDLRKCPEFHQRKEFNDSYYKEVYKKADSVCCSGRALHDIINDIFEREKSVLAVQLKKRALSLQLLIVDPDSPYVNELEKIEFNTTEETKKLLTKVYSYYKNIKNQNGRKIILAQSGRIQIRLTRWPLNSTLFYYKIDNKEKMLVGMLYNGVRGQDSETFEIENESDSEYKQMFSRCKKNFDETWHGGSPLFDLLNNKNNYRLQFQPPEWMDVKEEINELTYKI